ncbi:MAG: polysaccharide biosynthesis tyrosine autokinase [Polaribacter sp.]|nr:polysaccharide biosynthesis tyrosine autokinase [Polaribacter sp.]
MKEFQDNNQEIVFENNGGIGIQEELGKYLFYWKWFILGIIITFCSAYFYLKLTSPVYSASAYIMIKDNMKSGISDELKAVADLGIVGTNSTNNPENEIFIIKSRKIIGKVVDSLNLNISYFIDSGTRRIEVYQDSPIKFVFKEKNERYQNIDTSFVVSWEGNNKITLKNEEGDFLLNTYNNEEIKSDDLGSFKIQLDSIELINKEVFVNINQRKRVVSTYNSRINVTAVSEFSSILKLEVNDKNRLKAEHVLDELIKQYNLDAIIDKNIVSQKTKSFIDERLGSVTKELAAIQDNLKNYKTDFGISGLSEEAEMAVARITYIDSKIIPLRTKLRLIEWAEQDLEKHTTGNEIIPENLVVSDEIVANTIKEFNKLVIEKNRLLINAGEKNPNLINLNNRILVLRNNLKANLQNLKYSVDLRLNKAIKEAKVAQIKVNEIPLIERGIIDIQRQKAIYSELYSYLLRKKEDIAISLAVTVPNAKIIDVAFSSGVPVSPKKSFIYLVSLCFGIIIPFVAIYLKLLLDNKIHNRKDIENLTNIPYLGDIPYSESKDKIILNKGARTSTAEAFRLLRTNLNFILSDKDKNIKAKTIFVTSTISGEGKSFVSINLAATLALTGKKVLLIGIDLRAPKITNYLEIPDRKGLTNYIMGDTINLDKIKFNIPEIENVDFISSGLIPPNPSELLLNPKVKKLFETVKKEYDYVIADTAPVSLVTDTLLMSDLADTFLYVTRANHLDRKMLIVPNTLYKEKKLPNMAIVLNGTDSKRGYGYGYGYVESEKVSLIKRLFG